MNSSLLASSSVGFWGGGGSIFFIAFLTINYKLYDQGNWIVGHLLFTRTCTRQLALVISEAFYEAVVFHRWQNWVEKIKYIPKTQESKSNSKLRAHSLFLCGRIKRKLKSIYVSEGGNLGSFTKLRQWDMFAGFRFYQTYFLMARHLMYTSGCSSGQKHFLFLG